MIQSKSTPPILFGAWLKVHRQQLGLTRVTLAQRIGCTEITLQKIEQDQRRPSKQIAELLANALQIPAASRDAFVQFARGAGEPPVLDGNEPRATAARSQSPTNLPAPLTSFIDRTHELAAVQARLTQPDVRLLTLVGSPGIGKTRLSIQAGQAALDHFADGIWFVALAPISDPTNVLSAIARIFEIGDGASPLLARLQAHLYSHTTLLILDNFEHVLDAAPNVADLLKACPKVKVLATSRVPLQVYGEYEYPIPALALPPKNMRLSPHQIATFDAIKLFVARVQAFQPDFTLNMDNAQPIVDICVRMDGMPLAIELAASHLRRFTPLQLRDALHDAPLQVLSATARDVEPRQRTLRDAIQWSYNLLDRHERAAFNQLGVFAGGCTTEAALAVCELSDDAVLHALADQNLIKRDLGERWMMLEMMREFALDALAQLPSDALEQAQQRHAEYFARILKHDSAAAYRAIDVEQHNARAALRWLLDHEHPLIGDLALFMSFYFDLVGLINEAQLMLTEVLSAGLRLNPFVQCCLHDWASIHAGHKQNFEDALHHNHEAVGIARRINLLPQVAAVLITRSRIHIEMGKCDQAKQIAIEALEIGRAIQNSVSISGALVHLGEAEQILGNINQAATYFEEAYMLCHASDFHQQFWPHIWLVLACKGMGEVALSRGNSERALGFLRESLECCKVPGLHLWVLEVTAGIIATMPQRTMTHVQRAAKIWGAIEVLGGKMETIASQNDSQRINALIAEARTRITPKDFDAAWAAGRELSLAEAIALAMMQ